MSNKLTIQYNGKTISDKTLNSSDTTVTLNTNGKLMDSNVTVTASGSKEFVMQTGTPAVEDRDKLWVDTDDTTQPSHQWGSITGTLSNQNDLQNVLNTKSNNTMASNPNLLDNGWFTINQRGQSTYAGGGVYGPDRWKSQASDSVMTVNNSGCTFTKASDAYLQLTTRENFISLGGKVVTCSVLYQDGTMSSGTATFPVYHDDWINVTVLSDSRCSIQIFAADPASNSYQIIRLNINTASVAIRAIKLELGSVSTLTNDREPDYTTELFKCQRYCVVFQPVCIFANGYANSNGSLFTTIPMPTKMRAVPSINPLNRIICRQINTTKTYSASSVLEEYIAPNGIGLQLAVNGSGYTIGYGVDLYTTDANIVFSADL